MSPQKKPSTSSLLENDYLDPNSVDTIAKEHSRRIHALEKGLAETATWTDIIQHNAEIQREEYIKELGLPITATWKDITEHNSNKSRKELAIKRGLPETATWEEINKL